MRECTQTITIFNARMDPETGYDTYVPTILRGVSWFAETASAVSSDGLRAANRVTIRVPADADFSGKGYTPPESYPAADPSAAFTMRQGDLIIHAEETQTMTAQEIRAKYGGIITILGVADSRHRPRGKHWKVVGS